MKFWLISYSLFQMKLILKEELAVVSTCYEYKTSVGLSFLLPKITYRVCAKKK